jgi:hypothetical protein
VHDDEEAHRLELRRLREEAELAEFNALKASFSSSLTHFSPFVVNSNQSKLLLAI